MENLTRKEKNKANFLSFALKEFVENGIYDTKVSDIAKRAGTTERTAFRYYSSKQEMVLEAIRLLWRNYMAMVSEEFKQIKEFKGLKAELKGILMLYGEFFLTDKKELLFVSEAEAYLTRCGVSIYVNKSFPLDSNNLGPLYSSISKGLLNGEISRALNIEDLYYNCFDTLLGFMEKLVIEFYNNRIDEEKALRRLNEVALMLANSFF